MQWKTLGAPALLRRIGATIVAPHASDLILPLSVAVHAGLSVTQLAQAFSIYPSLGGSIQEAARRLYAKAGFIEYGHQINALKHGGRYYDDILMVKFLGP